MDDKLIAHDWKRLVEGVIGCVSYFYGMNSSDVLGNGKKWDRFMLEQIEELIREFYSNLQLGKEMEKQLSVYGSRAAKVKSRMDADIGKAEEAAVRAVCKSLLNKGSLHNDVREVTAGVRQVMAERGKTLENLIRAYAGQMMRYMVLWDCEDAGYTSYRFVAEGENCPECDALDGRVFPISEASSGENLAPMHPNCDCGAEILDRSGNAVLTIGGAKKAGDSAEKRNAFTPLLRIPEDAGKLLREFWDAQAERTQNIKGPLSFLDWLTLGIPRGIWEGMEKRGQDMRDAPGAYSIGNWLTMGLLDTAKGALAPDEPLSLEHWLDSAAVAGAAAGAYELGKYAVGKGRAAKRNGGVADEAANTTADLAENVKKANPNKVRVNQGHQDKHIPGTNNYKQEIANGRTKSILLADPQELLDNYAGTGQKLSATKERVNFGKKIGQYYDDLTGEYLDTANGIIHYDHKGGAHIVPSRP